MTTTYTVFCADDSASVQGRGLSLAQAADCLLTADGYEYEVRDEDGLLILWISDGSQNSTRGARNFRSCAAGGYIARDLDALHSKIVAAEWHGLEAATDEDYACILRGEG
jgi:hypothetical protein